MLLSGVSGPSLLILIKMLLFQVSTFPCKHKYQLYVYGKETDLLTVSARRRTRDSIFVCYRIPFSILQVAVVAMAWGMAVMPSEIFTFCCVLRILFEYRNIWNWQGDPLNCLLRMLCELSHFISLKCWPVPHKFFGSLLKK